MPTYGTQHATNFIRPAFGNAAGKYFLRQSSWTDNYVKEITYYLFHQHGDAYMTLYSEVPQELAVEMLPVLPANSEQYTVKADEGATICLTANGQIIGYDIAIGNTQEINITPQEEGTLVKLTITKQNYFRYEHFIKTISTEKPYLIFDAIEINDEEGNSNQAPDYNETCRFGFNLRNAGFSPIGDFNATLSCSHPAVEVSQNTYAYGGMSANETQMQSDAFTVHFGDELYDQERVKFYLSMDNDDYSFLDSVTLIVKAPKLKYGQLNITDLDGNPSDRLMKGQSSFLTFNIENTGESKSMEVYNQFKLLAPFLNVEDNEVDIPAIEAGALGKVTFQVHVDDDAVDGIIKYSLQAESGFHTDRMDSQIPLGYTTENFEGEILNQDLQWNLGSGNKKWYISEDETALEGHCMRSPSIGNNAIANLHIGIHTEINDTFSFYHKTSTEEGDGLILTLNGIEAGTWSGIGEWTRSEFELPAGNNLIRFSFKKDNEGSDGEDAVMIDELRFPPFAKMVLYAGDDDTACPNDTYTPKGYIYNQTELTWSTLGDGTFDDTAAEYPNYTFGESDKAEGRVELILTGTSSFDGCQQSSSVTVNLLPSLGTSHTPETPSGSTEIDLRVVSESEYIGEETDEAIYTWRIAPLAAGSIISEGHRARVEWNSEYRGLARINYRYENPCGATTHSEALRVNVFNSTGIVEQNSAFFEVYPNPTDGKINLFIGETLPDNARIEVYNLLGELMLAKNVIQLQKGETFSLDLHHFVSGLYIIKLSTENGSCSKKVSVR